MSKHYKKIIDLIKNEEESKYETIGPDHSFKDIEDIFTSGKDISEEEYLSIMTGNHKRVPAWNINESLGKVLALSSNNNPQTNSKALQTIHESKDDDGDYDGAFKHLSARGNLKGEDISKFIDGTYVDARERDNEIIKNPLLRTQHLEEFAEKNPNQIESVMNHENYSPKMLTSLLNKEGFRDQLGGYNIDAMVKRSMKGYNLNGDHLPDEEQSLDLHPTAIRQLIEHGGDKARSRSLNVLLDHADPTFKKQWTDEKLGITDGSHGHTFPEDYDNGHEDEDFKNENWNNWATGQDSKYNEGTARFLAGSRHIDDSQADHIKRHADIDQKYKLYENKHVDPKHGAEMFKKWHDDEDHHGYDASELNEYHKQNHKDKYTTDDLDLSILEEIEEKGFDSGEIDESADEAYSISNYFEDEEDSIVRDIISGRHYDDEVHEIADEKIREEYSDSDDWHGENPNSSQNVGDANFDNLNKLWEAEDDGHLSLKDLQSRTGLENWTDLGLEADDDGEVHSSDIKEKLDEYGGPLNVDFADHDELHISEHPEYESRHESVFEDAVREHFRENPWDYSDNMYLYESHRESDGYQEGLAQAKTDYIEENAKDYMDELFDGSHQDTRFIPHHLHNAIPNFHELNAEQKSRQLDGPNKAFLNSSMKDRSYEHSYGEGQHHHEMVKDYAEANGGSIDVGTMNKLFPNQKDTWKKIFDGKGKISSDEASAKIEALPKTNYDISFGKWDKNKMQNLNNRDQVIMRLDHSPESIKPLMEDSAVYDTFNRVQDTSQQSGHPTRKNTIAWARVDTTDPDHWMIDEIQSDFGKTVQRYLKKEGADDKAGHIDTINDSHKNWRETLTNAVLKEAKKHGAQKVSTHSPESKHSHAAYGADKIHSTYKKGYKQVPRSMGFRADSHENLPLEDSAKQYFQKESKQEQQINEHKDAYTYHNNFSNLYSGVANGTFQHDEITDEHKPKAGQFAQQHADLANKHLSKLGKVGVSGNDAIHPNRKDMDGIDEGQAVSWLANNDAPSTHDADAHIDKPFDKTSNFEGHTFELTPKFLKKNMDDFLELYDKLEKGDGFNALKAGIGIVGLMHGAHYIGQDSPKQKAAQEFSGGNQPAHSRSVANVDHKTGVVQQAYDDAKKEGESIIARNDKKGFLGSHGEGLSPHVYKQTIKQNSDLNEKYNYTNKLSNGTFKEIIKKNPHLREDVHSAHYDKLHNEFGGDHEKMSHAWNNGVQATYAKFAEKAPEAPQMKTKVDAPPAADSSAPEANFTHRRARGSR